ncbi:hypothetical protein [Arenibacter latericius]|uniref:hypothetical protein n=1 Tax=Arenibacter latericius TaxID=86104 RepID=UPI0004215CBB|nr:hypothetical protein [Arenibacter latericius]
MDYTIYIVLAALAIVFFMTQGMTRKKNKDRKSRKFMESYREENRNKSREEKEN